MAAVIKYDILEDNNFLRDSEYLFYISNFLNEFEDKFKLAEKVFIRFEESINPNPNNPNLHELDVTENGKEIKLVYKSTRNNQPNGGLSKPSDVEFFRGLRFYLTNIVIKEDNDRFAALNLNQEEE
jgi:hypothetical protein